MSDNYERWSPKPPPKDYACKYICMATGYLSGHTATLSLNVSAQSHTDAMRMFGEALNYAGMVNLIDYHVLRENHG